MLVVEKEFKKIKTKVSNFQKYPRCDQLLPKQFLPVNFILKFCNIKNQFIESIR